MLLRMESWMYVYECGWVGVCLYCSQTCVAVCEVGAFKHVDAVRAYAHVRVWPHSKCIGATVVFKA